MFMPRTVKTGGDVQIPEWLRKQSETIAEDRETVYNILDKEQARGNRLTRTTLRQKCEESGLPSDKTLASDRFKSALNALLKEGAVKEGPGTITAGFSGDIPIKEEVLKAVKSPLTKEEYFKSVEKDWRGLERVPLQKGGKGEDWTARRGEHEEIGPFAHLEKSAHRGLPTRLTKWQFDKGREQRMRNEASERAHRESAKVLERLGYSSEKEFREAVRNMETGRMGKEHVERRRREMAKLEREMGLTAIEEMAKRFPELNKKKADRTGDISTVL